MGCINSIVRVYQQADAVLHLFLIGVKELIEGGHILHGPCLQANLLSLIPAVGENKLQRTAHVKERRIMPAFCFSRLLRFHAANDVVGPGILQRQSPVHQGRDDHFVIIVGRKPDSGSCQPGRLHKKLMGRAVPNPDGQGRLGKEHMGGCPDAQEGKIVGHIPAVFILASHNQVLEQAVARKAFCAGRVSGLVQVIQLHPDAVNQFLSLIPGNPAFVQILFIIRIHVLVKASRRNGVSAGFHL